MGNVVALVCVCMIVPHCRCSDLYFVVGALNMEQDGEKEEVEE